MTNWASLVKDLRSIGMTFPEIGALIGLAPSSVSDIEHGYTKVPGGDAALRLVDLHRSKFADSTTRKCG